MRFPLDFRGAFHCTFEAFSTGLSRRSSHDFRGALHWTFNFRCFDKDLCIKYLKHKIQFEVTKRGQKQNRKIKKYFDPLHFRGALHGTFNFRCFDRDLCIKCFTNMKIQFEVTKRGQNQNQKIKNIF